MKSLKSHWTLYLLLAVPVIYVFIFSYIPMGGLQIAFKELDFSKGFYGGDWVGLKHFKLFFSSYVFWRIIKNTIWISFCYLILGFPAPVLLALSLNEVRNAAFKKSVQLITYAPYFISTVVMVSIIMQVLSPYSGLVNKFIQLFGGDAVNFMGKPQYFVGIYVLSGIWQGMGYVSIVFIAALSTIDPTLYEAVNIDGASKLQKIIYIDIPSLLPTMIIMMILNMGSVMNVGFEKVFLMQNEMNISASDVISTYVYQSGLVRGEYGYATAVGLFNSVINLLLVIIFNTSARKFSETSIW
ncbi:MAG: ABC transporter permease subunit [Clostridiaceae bacterium]|nr:ABC transporter permease subunit [Clostridiaceae bacterium]